MALDFYPGLFILRNQILSIFGKQLPMPLVPSFTASQVNTTPLILTLSDTSTGSDAAVTTRWVYLQKADGSYLTPVGNPVGQSYIIWPLPLAVPINISAMDKDYALNITVQWMAGTTIAYTKTILQGFPTYSKNFLYALTQIESNNIGVLWGKDYKYNKAILQNEVDSGNQAITDAADIVGAQACYDRATYMVNNKTLFF